MAAGDGDGGGGGALVEVRGSGAVRTIALARPDARNALSAALRDELTAATTELARDRSCRVVVLRGEGPSFSAGADLRDPAMRFEGEWARRRDEGGAWARSLDALEALPQPTIAALHGHVVGGGAVLALCCDLRVADESTVWRIPEVAIGVPLTWAGIPRLVREVGLAAARDLVMTCRPVPADEALRLGLVQRLVPAGVLDDAVDAEAERLAALPPGALQVTKASFAALGRHVGGRELFWADPDLLQFAMTSDETLEAASTYWQRSRENPAH